MSGWKGLGARLRGLLRRREAEQRMDEEIRFHLDMEAQRYQRLGHTPEEARRLARVAFGGVERHRETLRDGRRVALVEDLVRDLGYAVRVLGRSRSYTAAAVLCLALGIGVNTAVFSVVNAVNLRPLPLAAPEQLVAIHGVQVTRGGEEGISGSELEEIRSGSTLLLGVEGYAPGAVSLGGGGAAERVASARVTTGMFELLGVRPILGRGFAPEGSAEVVIGESLWRSRFGGDAGVIGREVPINGVERRVVGVMPEAFGFPETARLWLPTDGVGSGMDDRWLMAIGRLAPGATPAAVRTDLNTLAAVLAAERPEAQMERGFGAQTLRDRMLSPARRQMLNLMLVAVGLVLLIACANVANLTLARNAGRARELAVRRSLGAAGGRVVRQLLAEALLVSLAAGVLGVAIASGWLRLMVSRVPMDLPYFARFTLDWRVLAFTLLVCVATAILVGLAPALGATRAEPRSTLAGGGRPGAGGRRAGELLIPGQVAVTLLLLASATLLIRSAGAAVREDVGFETRDLLTFRTSLAGEPYDPTAVRADFFLRLAERLQALPGVEAAAAVTEIPGDRGGVAARVRAGGGDAGPEIDARWIAATPGLLPTLGLPLLAGREISAGEAGDSTARVAVVSRSLAERLWPGTPAAELPGREIRIDPLDPATGFVVVGVAPDLHYHAVGEPDRSSQLQIHLPYAVAGWRLMSLMVRGAGPAEPLQPAVRGVMEEMDPSLAVFGMMGMDRYMKFSNWERRLSAEVFTSFGSLALLLALLGVYGVASHSVSRRAHEIGVRMALGAAGSDVLGMIVRRTLLLTLVGLFLGLPLALGAARTLRGALHGVEPTDPITFLLIPVLLALAALAASALPARRATRLDPMRILREE